MPGDPHEAKLAQGPPGHVIEIARGFGGLRETMSHSGCGGTRVLNARGSMIRLRVGEPADAAAFADLHIRSAQQGFKHIFSADALAPSKDELTRDWISWLWSDPSLAREATVVERRGQVVGVIVTGLDHPSDPTVGRLTRAYVDPQVWGSRVAQLMFNAATDRLRDIGCTRAVTWIMEPNHRARKTVEHLGMHITGKRQPTCEKAASGCCSDVEDVEYEIFLRPAEV